MLGGRTVADFCPLNLGDLGCCGLQNIHWSEHATHEQIYCKLPPVSQKLTNNSLQFAGHCKRAKGEIIESLQSWKPSGSVHSRKMTFPGTISRDSGIDREHFADAMSDRNTWNKIIVQSIPTERAE